MQVISENEDERRDSGRTSAMDSLICTRRISRCIERECSGRIRIRGGGIRVSGRFFDKFKEGIWRRKRRVGESGGAEEAGTGRKDNGGICTGVQMGSKREWV